MRKNERLRATVGTLALSVDPSTLILGRENRFTRPSISLASPLRVDGAQSKNAQHRVGMRFDGAKLQVWFGSLSTALRNRNLSSPIENVADSEELLLTFPERPLTLSVTIEELRASADLTAHILLRDFPAS
jgi:hypothetical protein